MARVTGVDRSRYLRLTLSNKTSGRAWNLTDGTEGVEIQKNTSQLLTDADADTYWIKSIYGMSYQGSGWKQRRPTFSLNIHHPDPDQWMQIDSDLRDDLGMFDDGFRIMYRDSGGTVTDYEKAAMARAGRVDLAIAAVAASVLPALTSQQALEYMRTYKPDVYIPAHHDGSINELWRPTEPIFQAIKDENPRIVTISKGYREPSCLDTSKRTPGR